MKILKKSRKDHYKVSLILLDWSVRESFHLLHYLRNQQAVSQDDFEVIFIEYYSEVSPRLLADSDRVDQLIALEMPGNLYYHKHLMYNAGIALSRGDIIVICDSDAMVRPSFIQSILDTFAQNPACVLHLDQFRNNRKDLYPFAYPAFHEVTGPGCINYAGGVTAGLATNADALHKRNYGACFCARRDDVVAIGGADEHIDYAGHICGPYDLTFRLINQGVREIWHPSEFLYHTWHPGQAGEDNYMGPHDGRHMALASLEALQTGRVNPLLANKAVAGLGPGQSLQPQQMDLLIEPGYQAILDSGFLNHGGAKQARRGMNSIIKQHRGYFICQQDGRHYIQPPRNNPALPDRVYGSSPDDLRQRIDRLTPGPVRLLSLAMALLAAPLAGLMLFRRHYRSIPGAIRTGTLTRRLAQRLRGLKGYAAGAMDELFPLCNALVKRRDQAFAGPRADSLMLVAHGSHKAYLTILIALGLLQKADIRVIHGEDEFSGSLQEFQSARRGRLWLTRELYINYHFLVSNAEQPIEFSLL